MFIAVIGVGNFGAALGRRLYELGHKLALVDRDQRNLGLLENVAQIAVLADATERAALEEAGVAACDAAVVAMGDNMTASILATLHLKEMGMARIVAKAVTPEHKKVLSAVGASDVVYPERDAAVRLASTLTDPNLVDYVPLGPGISVAEITAPESWQQKSLLELEVRRRHGVNIIAVKSQGEERFELVSDPDYRIRESDVLVVVGPQEEIQKLH